MLTSVAGGRVGARTQFLRGRAQGSAEGLYSVDSTEAGLPNTVGEVGEVLPPMGSIVTLIDRYAASAYGDWNGHMT